LDLLGDGLGVHVKRLDRTGARDDGTHEIKAVKASSEEYSSAVELNDDGNAKSLKCTSMQTW